MKIQDALKQATICMEECITEYSARSAKTKDFSLFMELMEKVPYTRESIECIKEFETSLPKD